MAWTAPRTWVTAEVVTAAQLNTHVRDNFLEAFRAIDRSNTVVDLANFTTTAKSLHDGSAYQAGVTGWTIPAGVMGAARGCRVTITGDALYANSDSDNCTISVILNGATVVSTSDMFTNGLPTAGTREGWSCVAEVWNLAANSQIASLTWNVNNRIFSRQTGTVLGTADTTVDWKLDIVALWTAASANLSLRRRHCVVELI